MQFSKIAFILGLFGAGANALVTKDVNSNQLQARRIKTDISCSTAADCPIGIGCHDGKCSNP